MMDQNNIFPYQNYSLSDMEGEVWLDFPEFEGMYEISNYGRIKSLRRIIVTRGGGIYKSKERILIPNLRVKLNKTVNEPNYVLYTCPSKDGRQHGFSIGRVVYYTFIEKINLHGFEPLISYHDNDGRNVHVSNLRAIDMSSLHIESFKKKRKDVLRKLITRFDLSGKPIRHYNSIMEASRETGLSDPAISKTVNGKGFILGECFWRAGHHIENLDVAKIGRNETETLDKDLIKRLKLKNIDPENPPAFLNLSLEPMKGEVWKDLPNYQNLYQISNYGRIKSLMRASGDNNLVWYPEKIMRLTYTPGKNNHKGFFRIVLRKKQKKKYTTVARLVYCTFVQRVDLSEDPVRVTHKDGNPFNLHYKNLILKKEKFIKIK